MTSQLRFYVIETFHTSLHTGSDYTKTWPDVQEWCRKCSNNQGILSDHS
jgi:hypothetical protein